MWSLAQGETSLFGSFEIPLKAGEAVEANYKRLCAISPPWNKPWSGTITRLAFS